MRARTHNVALVVTVASCWFVGATQAQEAESVVLKLIEEERQFVTDVPCDERSQRDKFDFVVVGAGAAGSVVARRLADSGRWSVLLLEAGEDETWAMSVPMLAVAQREAADWGYTLEPAPAGCPLGPQGRCTYSRGKGMGGSTTINAMMNIRGVPTDYDEWARLGNAGWGYQDVLKYFRKSENMQIPSLRNSSSHGTDGPMPISYAPYSTRITDLVFQAAEEQGIAKVDSNGGEGAGVGRVQTFTRAGQRWSASRAYLWGAGERERRRGRRGATGGLAVRKRSLVTRVLFDALERRARGVRYERDGATHEAFAKREVVLCAGAINTPQLLMLSGVGPRNHLEELGIPMIRDLPVGQGLIDHSMFLGIPILLNESVADNITQVFGNPKNYFDYITKGEGPLTGISGVEMLYTFQAGEPKYQSEPNMEMYTLQFPPKANMHNTNVDIYRNLTGKNAIVPILTPLQPISRGNVSLSSKDIHDQPKIYPNFFGEELDVRNAVEGIKKMLELFLQTDTFRKVGAMLFEEKLPTCEDYEFATDAYWVCAVKRFSLTTYHPCCTCRMGPKGDPAAVVDSDLKVKGIDALRVVDASVFPGITSGHLEAPTLMVAEKAADLIKEDHRYV